MTDVHPHALRHSVATLLAMEGVDSRSTANLLGHDPDVTERTYTHAQVGLQLAAATAMGQALDRAVEGRPVLTLLSGGRREGEG